MTAFTIPFGRIVAASLLAVPLPAAAQNVLRVPFSIDIGSFDPDNAFETQALSAINNVYEGLVEYIPGSTDIGPALAESWTISDDGLTYIFDLVDGATFHDGTPVDSAAVLASMERRGSETMMLNYFLWNVTGIEAPDGDTVVFTLGMPQPSFLDYLSSPWGPKVISPAAIEGNPPEWFAENAVGSGPFRLTEFNRGQQYVLEKFEDYHGEEPYFDVVEIPVIPDIGQQILQLRAGDIDAVPTNYPWAQLAALPPGLELTAAPSMALLFGYVKPGSPLAEDADLRAAVMTALDPDIWVEDIYGPYATPALSLFPATMLTPETPVDFPSDMASAAAAVTAAGGLSLTIGYGSEGADDVDQAADIMAAQLAAIGVDAEVVVLPAGAVYGLQEAMDTAPDIVLTRSVPDAAHPETQAGVFYTTGAILNLMGASLPEADEIANGAFGITDIAARDAAYAEASDLWIEAGLFLPFADVQDVVVHAEGLTDLGLRPVFLPGNIDFGTVRFEE
ncbi:ABC transporter substrate-binding protein [Histidinibacterium lentulum]|nr:ABC transporter substrate-binding protein [Histidinibacterium lentulum]